MTALTQDEQPVFTLGKMVRETTQLMMFLHIQIEISRSKWVAVPTYVGMRRPFQRLHWPRDANKPNGVVFFPDGEEEHSAV